MRVPVGERDNDAARLEELIGPQQPIRALGIVALDLTPAVAQLLPPLRRDKGVVVARVTPEAPYSQQGQLEPGDVIHAVNGKFVSSVEELKTAAAALKPGAAAVLQVERDSTLFYHRVSRGAMMRGVDCRPCRGALRRRR